MLEMQKQKPQVGKMAMYVMSQVFGLLDMHEQLDAQLPVLRQVLANTNSGNVFKVHPFSGAPSH